MTNEDFLKALNKLVSTKEQKISPLETKKVVTGILEKLKKVDNETFYKTISEGISMEDSSNIDLKDFYRAIAKTKKVSIIKTSRIGRCFFRLLARLPKKNTLNFLSQNQ